MIKILTNTVKPLMSRCHSSRYVERWGKSIVWTDLWTRKPTRQQVMSMPVHKQTLRLEWTTQYIKNMIP